MYHVIGLKQTCGIKNVNSVGSQKIRGCYGLLGRVINKYYCIFLHKNTQAAQTLFVIYVCDSIALPFEPFKRMYENGSKIALNSTCSKGSI